MIRSVLIGTGSALPARIVTNDELAAQVDTSDQWIIDRTGIHQRHIASTGETTSSLATDAARQAIAAAGIEGSSIDLVIVATATPRLTNWPTSTPFTLLNPKQK